MTRPAEKPSAVVRRVANTIRRTFPDEAAELDALSFGRPKARQLVPTDYRDNCAKAFIAVQRAMYDPATGAQRMALDDAVKRVAPDFPTLRCENVEDVCKRRRPEILARAKELGWQSPKKVSSGSFD